MKALSPPLSSLSPPRALSLFSLASALSLSLSLSLYSLSLSLSTLSLSLASALSLFLSILSRPSLHLLPFRHGIGWPYEGSFSLISLYSLSILSRSPPVSLHLLAFGQGIEWPHRDRMASQQSGVCLNPSHEVQTHEGAVLVTQAQTHKGYGRGRSSQSLLLLVSPFSLPLLPPSLLLRPL